MPENDFEKQVQQKMDELHFVPSAAVWSEVEKEITDTKKRRRVLVWLLFFLLIGGSASFYFYNEKNKPGSNAQITPENISKNETGVSPTKDNPEKSKATYHSNNDQKNNNKNSIAVSPKKDSGEAVIALVPTKLMDKNPASVKTSNALNKSRSSKTDNDIAVSTNRKIKVSNPNNIAGDLLNTTASNKVVKNRDASTHNGSSLPEIKTTAASTKKIKRDRKKNAFAAEPITDDGYAAAPTASILKTSDVVIADEQIISPVIVGPIQLNTLSAADVLANGTLSGINESNLDTAVTNALKTPLAANKKKINWGIVAAAGISNTSKGFSVFGASPVRDASLNFSQPSNGTGAGNSTVSNGSTSASDVKPGAAFMGGIFIRAASKTNWHFFAGIHYAYFSTSIAVGRKIDSSSLVSLNGVDKSISSYYQNTGVSGNSTINYTNQYHFIEVSPGIEAQLSNRSRFAFNGGLNISRLISSNALQYDAQKNIYYQDNSLFNKTQLGLFAGFNYRLLQQSNVLTIGPQFNYGLTNLFKNESAGNRHTFFIGVAARIFFHRK